jgi:predicted phosphodiesterase
VILSAILAGAAINAVAGNNDQSTDQDTDPEAAKILFKNVAGEYNEVIMIELEDGTRCALYDGFKKGGISCDWD